MKSSCGVLRPHTSLKDKDTTQIRPLFLIHISILHSDTYLFISYAAFMYVLYALYSMVQSALAEANSAHAKTG